MKKRIVYPLAAVGIFSLASNSVIAQEGRFYDLICRKGDNGLHVFAKEDNSIELTLLFRRSENSAARRNGDGHFVGFNALLPGECSWKYRRVRSDEPRRIKWVFERYKLGLTMSVDLDGAAIWLTSLSERPAEIMSPAQKILSTIAPYSISAGRPAEPEQDYFTIRVRNAGGVFVVKNDRYSSYVRSTRPGRDTLSR